MKLGYYVGKLIYKLQIPKINKSNISNKAKVCTGASVNFSSIDKYSYVGPFSAVNHTSIGRFCSIADNVSIGLSEHPLNNLSTSPVFLEGNNCLNINLLNEKFNPYKETIVENDVWIGKNACIKSGVKISNGAVIAMGAVVVKDVGPYEIWGGVPAKKIGMRFSKEIVEDILESQWWELDDTEIVQKYELLESMIKSKGFRV